MKEIFIQPLFITEFLQSANVRLAREERLAFTHQAHLDSKAVLVVNKIDLLDSSQLSWSSANLLISNLYYSLPATSRLKKANPLLVPRKS